MKLGQQALEGGGRRDRYIRYVGTDLPGVG